MGCIHLLPNGKCDLYNNAKCNIPSSKCEDYCHENKEINEYMKTLFGKNNNNTYINKETAISEYARMVTMFMDKLYPDQLFMCPIMEEYQSEIDNSAHKYIMEHPKTPVEIESAYQFTVDKFNTDRETLKIKFKIFHDKVLSESHSSTAYDRQVMTLMLGYLGKLDSTEIITSEDPEHYFWDKVKSIDIAEFEKGLTMTKKYVEAYGDIQLIESFKWFIDWIEKICKKTNKSKPKMMTIEQIERELGYKIIIVGESYEK